MKTDILKLLSYIDPAQLDYQEWVSVGMALKQEGLGCSVWDEWSSRDSVRYHGGECYSKWNTFEGASTPVTGGTIYQLACRFGYRPTRDEAMSWDDDIGRDNDDKLKVLDGVEVDELKIPKQWSPKAQIIKYLETLFNADENVGYVTECWVNESGRCLPKKGNYDRTAGQLIAELSKLDGEDIGAVFGDYSGDAGAWIRFNPLDGQGVKNSNVTDYRYALVESDSVDISTQNTLIRELELPVAALVYSGGKSVHAIVKVDAADAHEYRKRVEYLYSVCEKNGLTVDTQNKNPSRLSRMPGVIRKGKKQYLLDVNIGKENWAQWYEWVESVNDDLPDPECLTDFFDDLPPLAPPLIDGVLRQGHKMLIAGPSKAGKSFALIELAIAVAEGRDWLGFNCMQGKVLYVNLELDRASCLHRFADVYKAKQLKPQHIGNIDIWHLRGKSSPMDKLTPKLVRRAAQKGYIAVIIDPIYKVLTGDENSAEQMSRFCNEFDKICSGLGCAVIYCHHHSKGFQGTKSSMDRASGSGVFARDPDAMLDMIELELDENIKTLLAGRYECQTLLRYLKEYCLPEIFGKLSQDDVLSPAVMREYANEYLPSFVRKQAYSEVDAANKANAVSAWRINGTLREFPKFAPVNCWFDYPVHKTDDTGVLADIDTAVNSKNSPWGKNFSKRQTKEQRAESRKQNFETHFESLRTFNEDGKVSIKELSEQLGKTEKTIRNWIENDFDGYFVKKGNVEKIE